MMDIMIPTALLTAIVVAFASLVLLARAKLGATGQVSIQLDDGKVISVEAGRRLLWALADAGIYLPAACGGKGACGQCRVRIDEGRPELSQMGATHINTADAQAGYRLACMVRVWQGMNIAIDETSLGSQQWRCTVTGNRNISVYLKELLLQLPEGERIAFRAGEYIQASVPPYRLDFADINIDPPFDAQWRRLGLNSLSSETRETTVRAYSMANPPRQDREIRLVVRIATPPATAPADTPPGRSSSYLWSLRPGDPLSVSGPFGDFHASDTDRSMVLIAGGAGIAPMRSIILDQLDRDTGRHLSLWFGARNRNDLCYFDEFQALAKQHDCFDFHAVLSEPDVADNWDGATGFVHAVVHEQFLGKHPAPQAMEYYLCGPPLMATAAMNMLDGIGVPPEQVFIDDFGS